MLYTFLVIVDTLLAIAVVTLILLNRGQGAEVGAAFGGSSPASSSVFGSKGSTPFITKVISVLAGLFLLNSLGLAYLVNFQYVESSVIDEFSTEELRLDREEVDGIQDVPPYGSEGGSTNSGSDGEPDIPSDIPDTR